MLNSDTAAEFCASEEGSDMAGELKRENVVVFVSGAVLGGAGLILLLRRVGMFEEREPGET